jgi:hypothetical protein
VHGWGARSLTCDLPADTDLDGFGPPDHRMLRARRSYARSAVWAPGPTSVQRFSAKVRR